ncbi:hypothetical protein ZWY2020_047926 [Hordeum vulgare]|nr:hypothetical protein ZWY2020_047926 [Hordeum vulgare]
MGKKGDPKVPILPSTTRKGIVLSTSATLDSPSVISKFASPPPHAASTEFVTMPDIVDDASTTIDEPGLLGYFIESQIAKAGKQSGIEFPVTRYPIGRSFGYLDLSGLKERILDGDYIELDDDLCRELTECADSDPASLKKLLEKHSMKNKFTPDPKFASSPICIEDTDFDFSVDLSLISTVEADPFYGREDDHAIAHLTKLTELGGLFTTEEKKRNYYVTKLLPFSLKGDAKAWYDALPCGSIKSPQDLAQSFVAKCFPAHKQHAALQRIYNYKQLQDEHLPKAWGGIALCLRLDRTSDDAEELMGKIAENHDDWSVPEPPPSPKKKDLLANNAKQVDMQAYGINTRGGTHTQDPLYPEGHPKRIEQDSQLQEEDIVSSPKRNKKHKEADNSNDPITEEEPIVDPNSISISDAETEDDAEPDKDNEKIDPREIREEEALDKRKRTSEFGKLVYIMRFGELTTREIRLPAPLLFDYTSRNGWSFTSTELDEFLIQQQFHNPMEEVVPEEEEPSPWEANRASVYAPEASYESWSHLYHSGAGGSSWSPR